MQSGLCFECCDHQTVGGGVSALPVGVEYPEHSALSRFYFKRVF